MPSQLSLYLFITKTSPTLEGANNFPPSSDLKLALNYRWTALLKFLDSTVRKRNGMEKQDIPSDEMQMGLQNYPAFAATCPSLLTQVEAT